MIKLYVIYYKASKTIVVQYTLVCDIKKEKLVLLAYFWHIQKHFTPSCTFIASFNIAKCLVLTGKCMVPEKGIISPCYMSPYQGAQVYVYKYSKFGRLKIREMSFTQPWAKPIYKNYVENTQNYRYEQLSEHKNSIEFVGLLLLSPDDTP